MTTFNQLSAAGSLSLGDLIAIFSTLNGDTRKASLSTLLTFLSDQLATPAAMETQYAAPSASGFSVQVTDSGDSTWLVLTPTGAFAAGTLVLPALGNCVDKQEILVNCTQAVTTLTVSGNGATVTGAPTTLAANGFFRLRFEGVTNTWYRVG